MLRPSHSSCVQILNLSLCNFLHSPVTSTPSCPHTFFTLLLLRPPHAHIFSSLSCYFDPLMPTYFLHSPVTSTPSGPHIFFTLLLLRPPHAHISPHQHAGKIWKFSGTLPFAFHSGPFCSVS